MNCKQADECLKFLMDGELYGEDARAARKHLASCPECAARLTPSQWVEVLPARDEEIEPSGEFARRFYQKLEERRPSWWKRPMVLGWPRQLAAVSALLAVLVAGVLIGRHPAAREEIVAAGSEVETEETIPILRDMAVISNLDLLEDFETIQDLPNLMKEAAKN